MGYILLFSFLLRQPFHLGSNNQSTMFDYILQHMYVPIALIYTHI